MSVALRGLTADQAAQSVGQSTNSIFGIINHLVFWNERYLQRFKKGTLPPLETSNEATFKGEDSGQIAEDWDQLQQRLDNLFVQWEEAVITCD
ncbi:MAG TPA: DinB family protein, partial [Verrucomicrobiae bacterium]|nr:DinB family protein [Verrucomicrobiae bacterium]